MPLSFKTSVTYKKNVNFTPDNCVLCEAAFTQIEKKKQPSSDITRYFAGHYPVSGANVQA